MVPGRQIHHAGRCNNGKSAKSADQFRLSNATQKTVEASSAVEQICRGTGSLVSVKMCHTCISASLSLRC